MPRALFSARLLRKDVMRQRCGYWPVERPTREGEQIGEAT